MPEIQTKLDQQSKILLATQTINYLSHQLYGLNRQLKFIGDDPVMAERIKENEKVLNGTVERLSRLVEDLSNYMNGIDAVNPIDAKVALAANRILLFNQDDVDF